MARAKKTKTSKTRQSRVTVEKNTQDDTLLNRIQGDLENKNAILNLILGALIIIVGGILVFNYFNKSKSDITSSAPQTENTQANQDVSKDSLPGNYTVKQGDTLFVIAQKYYNDGYQYPQIVSANKLSNENAIQTGQTLIIPKLADSSTNPPASPIAMESPSPLPTTSASPSSEMSMADNSNTTIWGDKITSDTYTVQAGDWLSKISGRAYGDILSYQKIAQANNIADPNAIEVGTLLKIPRN